MQNKKETDNIGDKISNFVQKNRKGIFIFLGATVILLAGLIIFLAVQDSLHKKAVSRAEELHEKYEETRLFYYQDEDYFSQEIIDLLSELENFSKGKRGYPGGRAWSIIGDIYANRKDWQKSEEAYLNAAKAGDKTYLAPVSYFNAAVAAEEQGKLDSSIEHLEKAINHSFEFPAAPRAQFNIGRLYEQMGNFPAALEAYRAVIINWQDVPVWQYLARNAIISIEIR